MYNGSYNLVILTSILSVMRAKDQMSKGILQEDSKSPCCELSQCSPRWTWRISLYSSPEWIQPEGSISTTLLETPFWKCSNEYDEYCTMKQCHTCFATS